MLDKRELLEVVISQLSGTSEHVGVAHASARQSAIEAPGAMHSRYDSSKEEAQYLTDALTMRRNEIEDSIRQLRGYRFSESDSIIEGSLVNLQRDENFHKYFVLPIAGGEKIETEEGEIMVITSKAPLYNSMAGKKQGNIFTFKAGETWQFCKVIEVD